jgi:hypothetical protein
VVIAWFEVRDPEDGVAQTEDLRVEVEVVL